MDDKELVFSVSKRKAMGERLISFQEVDSEDAVKEATASILWELIECVTVDRNNDDHPLKEYAGKTLDEMKSACKETIFSFVSKEKNAQ